MPTQMRIPPPDRLVRALKAPPRAFRNRRAACRLLLLAAVLLLPPYAAVRAEIANPTGVAVIVGNGEYQHRDVPDVSFAHRDADAFRRYVVDVLGYDPENVIDLRDATRRELIDALGTRANSHGLLWSYLDPDGSSEIVLFYSGHGVPGLNDGRGYLLPVDADPKAAEDDGYPIDLLYENLGGLAEARAVQVYLDACFSGGSHQGVLIRDASPVFVRPALPEGVGEKVVSLTAASGEQVASWDTEAQHGLFTNHLLDALHGGGDADGDGRVTAVEAKRYLDRHMTRAARRQHRRVQVASLIGTADVVLAAAPANGAFPARRAPGALDRVPDRTVDDGDDDDVAPAFDLAAVTGGHAILTVETTPPGAAVLVGGVKVGETPFHHFSLRAGTYVVTLEHPTHETVVLDEQTLADNEVLRIERELARATGKVTVITRPVGAWVEQGGERLAETTPVTLDGLPSGSMVLRLGAEGRRTLEVEVEVPKGGVTRVERELEELRYGTLTLELALPEAEVRLLDVAQDYRPGMVLPPGTYRVRVSAVGWAAEETTIRHGTAPTRHEVTLTPERDPEADEAGLGLKRQERKLVQEGLAVAGFSPGPADGAFGKNTRKALRAWQASEDHEAKGYLTAEQARVLIALGREAALKRLGAKCAELKGQYLVEKHAQCWEEFADWPGCHWWTRHYHSDRTAKWSGRCDGGLAEGRGTLSKTAGSKHFSYEGTGTFAGGKGNGKWIEKYGDGARYEGEYRDGKQHRRGTYTWADGDHYEGAWRDGKPNGYGTLTFASGNRYDGQWRDGCFNQNGQEIWAYTTKEACGFQ